MLARFEDLVQTWDLWQHQTSQHAMFNMILVEMNADPVYVFLLVLIVFLLYIIVREKEHTPVSTEPTVVSRVIAAPSYYGWWPSRFYGGYAGDVWFRDHIGPGHYWGPHLHPGRRYF
jgi:hypothetical protein